MSLEAFRPNEDEAQYALECVLSRMGRVDMESIFSDLPERALEHIRLTAADYCGGRLDNYFKKSR